jgi:hypothetical protein
MSPGLLCERGDACVLAVILRIAGAITAGAYFHFIPAILIFSCRPGFYIVGPGRVDDHFGGHDVVGLRGIERVALDVLDDSTSEAPGL